MFYPANLQRIENELSFALLEKDRQINAIDTIILALTAYAQKYKQINKRFHDLIKEAAPKDKNGHAMFSTSLRDSYGSKTFNIYFSNRVLKISDNKEAYMQTSSETLYLDRIDKNDYTSPHDTSPSAVLALLTARREGLIEYRDKIKAEQKKLAFIYAKYNKLSKELDALTDPLTYYTREGLKGKAQYTLINN